MQEQETGMLRPDIELIQGKQSLLFDPAADAYYKISAGAVKIIAFLTESKPVSVFLEDLKRNGLTVTQPQLFYILNYLRQNNLLVPGYGHARLKRKMYAEQREKTAFLRFSAAYLFFRLPPLRPERLFNRIAPYVSWLASGQMVLSCLIPALAGYLILFREFNLIEQTFWNSLSWSGLVKYFYAILLLKLLHESAHSLAAMHFHCRVRGIGLGFMVFYPRLYTDTTDSWRLPRNQRLLIDAAGIIAELLCGGIAVLLWFYLPPGNWKATMFYIFTVSIVSTLMVNGNPCIRYDGYYILCDLLNIENLMTRSADYVKRWWRWLFLGLGDCPREKKGWFLLTFGILSLIYRIFLYTSIILIIYHKFTKVIAVIMMFLELYSIAIYPCYREFQEIRQLSRKSTVRARWLLALLVLLLMAGILFFPLRWRISMMGEIVPEKRTNITVLENGYLKKPLSPWVFRVRKNDLIAEQESPHLDYAIRRLQAQINYNQTLWKLQQLDEKQSSAAKITWTKLESDMLGLQEMHRRKGTLRITAPCAGFFISSLPLQSAGICLTRGMKIGEVISPQLKINVYADDNQIASLQIGDTVFFRVSGELCSRSASIVEISPVASHLRNTPLLQHFGGPIPIVAARDFSNEFISDRLFYCIVLRLEDSSGLDSGRLVWAWKYQTEQLYKKIVQFILAVFRKEF